MKNKTYRRKTRRNRKNRITKRGGNGEKKKFKWPEEEKHDRYRGTNLLTLHDPVKSYFNTETKFPLKKSEDYIDTKENPLNVKKSYKTESIVPTEIKSSVNEIQPQVSIRQKSFNKPTTRISLTQIKKNSLLHKREAQPEFETFKHKNISKFLTKEYLDLNNWKLKKIIKLPPTEKNMKIMSVEENDKKLLTNLLKKEQSYYKKINELNNKTYLFNFSKERGQKKLEDLKQKIIDREKDNKLFQKYIFIEEDDDMNKKDEMI